MNKHSRIFVAGHKGMVGSALVRALQRNGFDNILTAEYPSLDLVNQQQTDAFFRNEKPEIVFDAAAKVGGILANNSYRAEFIYQNLMIQSNLIHAAWLYGVKKLLFLGSSCIYPKHAPQPLKESTLLTGTLEYTNEPYAIAKIAGIKMCESYFRQYGCNFISVMPTNLYGPNDNFDPQTSHVLPALIRKIHEAKVSGAPFVIIWGTGKPMREFMHVDDLASACLFLMEKLDASQLYDHLNVSHINIGIGEDIRIIDLAAKIARIIGYAGDIKTDPAKPDGTPRKLLDVTLLHQLGFQHSISLDEGIRSFYEHWLSLKA